jgi:hypothetical protein
VLHARVDNALRFGNIIKPTNYGVAMAMLL